MSASSQAHNLLSNFEHRAPQPDAHAVQRSGTVIRCGQSMQGFYEDGGVPPRVMIEDAQSDARSFALAEYCTKFSAQKLADDCIVHKDQQQLLDLDWSSAIADGQTRPSPKTATRKPKRKAGKGKAAVQAASSSSAGGKAPPLISSSPEQQASTEEQAEPAAGLAADVPDAASRRPCTMMDVLERTRSTSAQHADSAAVSGAAVTSAGGNGNLGADSGSQHAVVASPASAASKSAGATDLSSVSENIDSSVSSPVEASSPAAPVRTSEGLQHASASSLPQVADTSTRLSTAARSSSVPGKRTASQAETQVGAP